MVARARSTPLSLVAADRSTNPTTEPRQGPAQTIVVTFDRPINAATVTITEGVATAAAPTFSGNDVVVGLTGVTDRQYVTVTLTNVSPRPTAEPAAADRCGSDSCSAT